MADDLPGREIRRKQLLEDGGEPHEPIYPNQEPEAADQPAPPLGRAHRHRSPLWRRETQARPEIDKRRAAMIAWRRFVSCVEALPQDQAAPLWHMAHDQAAARIAL